MNILIIDNYDSFTLNLYSLIRDNAATDTQIVIINNDTISDSQQLIDILPYFSQVIISPGPGHPSIPKDVGIAAEVLCILDSSDLKIPLLGICLGHQLIAHHYKTPIIHCMPPIHGQISAISHTKTSLLFRQIPETFHAVRYHSLVAQSPLKLPLISTAFTNDGYIMALEHPSKPIYGLQFHPESISTQFSNQIIQNFNQISVNYLTNPQQNLPNWILDFNKLPIPLSLNYKIPDQTFRLKIVFRNLPFYANSQDIFLLLFKNSGFKFWLDSARETSTNARFSYMGDTSGPSSCHISYSLSKKTITQTNSKNIKKTILLPHGITFFKWISDKLDTYKSQIMSFPNLPFDFFGGFVGYFGYELKHEANIQMANGHISETPDAMFIFSDRVIVFDHYEKQIYLLSLQDEQTNSEYWMDDIEAHITSHNDKLYLQSITPPATPQKPDQELQILEPLFVHSKHEYTENIKKCLDFISDGDSYELCLTTQLKTQIPSDIHPLRFYNQLRKYNPAPYACFFSSVDYTVCSSSPELFMRVDKQGKVYMKPIKGTLSRKLKSKPQDYAEWKKNDDIAIKSLENSVKNRSENLMIVDLIRNDLNMVSQPSSVCVPKLMKVESYEIVHQLVSTVESRLKPKYNALDAIMNCFPPGSMTGAPKLRSVNILETLENNSRGVYSGTLGYLSTNGCSQFNVVIRTAVLDHSDKECDTKISIGAGGAVIALSDANEEWDEMILKSNSVLKSFIKY